ncbi:MAG TPA: phospholipid carrier-dependent glycosyltransferase [Polyangiaceae bacterium]|nr:phospholipid carrier-dependent glycosyltransferase [Polyangiaceae bacterium]
MRIKSLAEQLRPVDVVIGALLLLGAYLRLHAFDFPSSLLFDEHHFVENARKYLQGQPDLNDHPPLGKLFIAAAMKLLGDTPAGFRVPALLFGFSSIAFAGWAAARLFHSTRAGLFAAALLSADGFQIAYSRAALLDGYLNACGLAALLLASYWLERSRDSRAWALALLSGAVCGVALGIKFSGVASLVPVLVALSLAKGGPTVRQALHGAVILSVTGVVYIATYAIGLALSGGPASVARVFHETARLYAHHAALTDMKNPATSGWVTWAVPMRPLLLGHVERLGSVRVLTSLGNLVSWWSCVLLSLSCLGWIGWRGVASTLEAEGPEEKLSSATAFEPSAFVAERGRAVLVVLSVALGFLAPWVLTHRDSYIYHFLPSYSALLVLLAGFLGWAETRRPAAVLWFFAAALVVAAFYAPVWSFFDLGPRALRARLFLASWR